MPCNADRSLWGGLSLLRLAEVSGLERDLEGDPQTVLADLLADLMHWCDMQQGEHCPGHGIDFESALQRARRHYTQERADELEAKRSARK